MRKRLPPRSQILAFLESKGTAVTLDSIAEGLDVDTNDIEALLRILDGMALDGEVHPGVGNTFRAKNVKATWDEPHGASDRKNGHRGLWSQAPLRTKKGLPPATFRREGERKRDRFAGKPSSKGERPGAGVPWDNAPSKKPGPAAETPKARPLQSNEREGTISVNARGFGFVMSLGSEGDDVFIPAESLRGAMHGDRVIVQVTGRSPRGADGTIVEIRERGTKRVAGVLRRRGSSAWLEPDDIRIRGPVVLTKDVDVRGPEGNAGQDGDAAIVAITRYPLYPGENLEGALEAVLGRPGELNVETAKILAMAQVREVHSEQANTEANGYGETVPLKMLEGRVDLTHLPLPTIDPEDARDHDDAVWVERDGKGGYVAWIAIADVSSYVVPTTKLDEEAKARGCSIYLPDRAIPMLPRALSSNLCSLLPDEIRLCLCVEAHIDAGGTVTESRILRGFMKSRAKLTYGSVARTLGLSEAPPLDEKAEQYKDGLAIALELSRILKARRNKRGALDFELPEAKIVLDKESGEVTDVIRRSEDAGVKKAYQLIEELMLLANETVAAWFVEKDIPGVFRIHEPPDEKKLARLGAMCEAVGLPFDVEDTRNSKSLQRLLKAFAKTPQAAVLNMLLLRSMKQATYDVENAGHFGLASDAYLHFTSPIRRYPDLVVHRIVHEVLLQKRIPRGEKAVETLREAALSSSTAERKSMEVERDVADLYRASLMRKFIGDRFQGTVTGLMGSGIFVALDSPFVDVLVRFEDLGSEPYNLDEDGLFVVGARSGSRITLGDRMVLDVIDVAMLRRTVYGRRIMGLENEENFGDEEPRKAKSKRDHVRGKKPKTSTETDPRRATRGAKDSSPGRHRSSGKKASPKTSQPLKKKKNSAKGVSAKGVSAKGVSAKGKKKTSTKKAKARK